MTGSTTLSFDFAVSAFPVITISNGSVVEVPIDDAVYDEHDPADITTEQQIEFQPAVGNPSAPEYTSLDPSIGTVDSSGYVTFVSDGDARINIRSEEFGNGDLTRRIVAPVSFDSGIIFQEMNRWASGSAARADFDLVDPNLSTPSPETAYQLFTAIDNIGHTYTRNTSPWIDWDLTCVPAQTGSGQTFHGTAITPRHVMFADHFKPGLGTTLYFVDATNTVYSRTLSSVVSVQDNESNNVDCSVGLLSSDLPAQITPAKLLPANWLNFIREIQNGWQCLWVDQFKHARMIGWDGIDPDDTLGTYGSTFHSDTTDAGYFKIPVDFDSGSPIFVELDNDTVLLTCFWHGYESPDGPFYSDFLSNIQAAIDSLGAFGHSIQNVDLSGFTDFVSSAWEAAVAASAPHSWLPLIDDFDFEIGAFTTTPAGATLSPDSAMPDDAGCDVDGSGSGFLTDIDAEVFDPSVGASFALWARPDIVSGSVNSGRYRTFSLDRFNGNAFLSAAFEDDSLNLWVRQSNSFLMVGGVPAVANDLYFIVVVLTPTQTKMYVDGVLQVTSTAMDAPPAGSFFSWAKRSMVDFRSLSGGLSQCLTWQRDLTPTEITDLYNAGVAS